MENFLHALHPKRARPSSHPEVLRRRGQMTGMAYRLLWGLGILLALVAVATRWADTTAITALFETRTVSIGTAIGAAGLVVLASLIRRTRLPILQGIIVAAAVVNALPVTWPYTTRNLTFYADGLSFSGTVFLPQDEPAAGVVFLHGSGTSTRNDFAYHAKQLARRGIAAFAYDKRGSGESEGNTWVNYIAYADDAAAAFSALETSYPALTGRIGYFGHSEGGWVAPVAAAQTMSAYIVVTGTTTMSPAEQVLYQAVHEVETAFGLAAGAQTQALQQDVLSWQRTGEAREGLDADLRIAASEPWFDAARLPDRLYERDDYAWWISVMDFDPSPWWRQVDTPVLALWGSEDNRSDPTESRYRLEDLISAPYDAAIYPQADHMVLVWANGEGVPPPTFPEGMMDMVAIWIKEQGKAG